MSQQPRTNSRMLKRSIDFVGLIFKVALTIAAWSPSFDVTVCLSSAWTLGLSLSIKLLKRLFSQVFSDWYISQVHAMNSWKASPPYFTWLRISPPLKITKSAVYFSPRALCEDDSFADDASVPLYFGPMNHSREEWENEWLELFLHNIMISDLVSIFNSTWYETTKLIWGLASASLLHMLQQAQFFKSDRALKSNFLKSSRAMSFYL